MGCFLVCFGASKDSNRKKKRNKRRGIKNPTQTINFAEQGRAETGKSPPDLVAELKNEAEEPLILSPRKRVTFNSNVTAYEAVSLHESVESLADTKRSDENEKAFKSREDHPSSQDDSVTSSVGSYPSNHRYQNCRESDDEAEECADSDLDDDEDDYNKDGNGRIFWSETVTSMESRTKDSLIRVNSEEVNSQLKAHGLAEQETKSNAEKGSVRDRSGYVQSVLNPVENLIQWKAVKSNGTMPLKPQKENFAVEDESPRASFSTEPTRKQSLSSFKSKLNQKIKSNQDMAVDTSLSTWLVSSEATPCKKTGGDGLETITSGRSPSQGSNSAISFEDRPILGALTVEELKQLSAASSTRRSPSRSPDDMPIIGTVGTYWNHANSRKDPNSASSFKGIPNTTSKYREDKRVNWHSTPFETRLERALKRGTAEA